MLTDFGLATDPTRRSSITLLAHCRTWHLKMLHRVPEAAGRAVECGGDICRIGRCKRSHDSRAQLLQVWPRVRARRRSDSPWAVLDALEHRMEDAQARDLRLLEWDFYARITASAALQPRTWYTATSPVTASMQGGIYKNK